MASEVEIANGAASKLGAGTIVSLTEDSVLGRACNSAYERCRDRLYEKYEWSFTMARAELAADSDAPTWGRANAFELPSDYIRLAHDYPEDNSNQNDYVVEGRKIYSDQDAPLYIRYVSKVTDPNLMPPLFRYLLECEMAIEMCESLTQSNTKKAEIAEERKNALREAKQSNAIQKIAQQFPEDEWITVRS